MKFYTKIAAFTNSLRSDEEGATAVEYGLMVSLVAVAIIAAVTLLGTDLANTFKTITDKLPTAAS
ncbi:Flp family type IVb pilin [Cryobacterium sp. Y11]|uniref:Flp family type IVb pilin n=1 Tax=Cryobacterium sp. Y11 TaxID=2045016 RepID=UPI000CE4FA48|nr:Flp family type IVb pilin [Cryobacterium sp. Y11]